MGSIWFGNLTKAGYVPAPETGMSGDYVGVEETLEYSNGGLFVANSGGTHREYNMEWGLSDRKYMDWLVEYRNGNHGQGLLYFVDPFASNCLPPHWATPMLTTTDWPSLIAPSVTPTRVETPASSYDMPRYGARYPVIINGGMPVYRQLVLLIPSDKTLHLGFTGTAINGGTVRAVPVLRATGADAASQDLTLLSPTGAVRLNTSFNGSLYSAVRIYLTTTLAGASSVTLYSAKGVYSSINSTPTLTGSHLSGQGHTGLRYLGAPTLVYVQAARGKQLVKAAAKFGEVGAWL